MTSMVTGVRFALERRVHFPSVPTNQVRHPTLFTKVCDAAGPSVLTAVISPLPAARCATAASYAFRGALHGLSAGFVAAGHYSKRSVLEKMVPARLDVTVVERIFLTSCVH